LAAARGHTGIVRVLLERAPNTAVDYIDAVGYTALLVAAQNHRARVIRVLADCGANVNYLGRSGLHPSTFLHFSDQRKHLVLDTLDDYSGSERSTYAGISAKSPRAYARVATTWGQGAWCLLIHAEASLSMGALGGVSDCR
jgi:ankyrin repeat protein